MERRPVTASERTQVKIAIIGIIVFAAALMGPGAIDRLLTGWGF